MLEFETFSWGVGETSHLVEHALKRAEQEGAFQAEAYQTEATTLTVIIEKKQVKIGEQKQEIGIGVRVAVKKQGAAAVGFAYTTHLTEDGISQAVNHALKVASVKKPDPDFKSFPTPKPHGTVEGIYDKKLLEVGPEDAIRLANQIIEQASLDRRILTVSGVVSASYGRTSIANSLGVAGAFDSTSFLTAVNSVAEEGGATGTGWDYYVGCVYDEPKALQTASNATSLAVAQIHKKPIKGEVMDLILQPEALGHLLLFTLIPAIKADQVQQGASLLIDKRDQQVSSETLTIIDNGRVPKAIGSKPFDDEGCATQKTPIIEKGILRNFLYHTYTALKEGVESTGNALRYTTWLGTKPKYAVEPRIHPTNLIIEPSAKTREDLIREVKNGIITKDLLGYHTANPQSGDFSVAVFAGFKIENGEVKYPVKQAMIGGNILELLKKARLPANDVKQVPLIADSTAMTPSMLFEEVTISA